MKKAARTGRRPSVGTGVGPDITPLKASEATAGPRQNQRHTAGSAVAAGAGLDANPVPTAGYAGGDPGTTPLAASGATVGSRQRTSPSRARRPQQRQRPRQAAPTDASDASPGANPVPAAGYAGGDRVITPLVGPGTPPVSDEGLTAVVGDISDATLGACRCAKALVEFSRVAGQRLADARAALGDQAFDRWVERTLAITPAEAVALIRFAQDPAIVMADVSPIKAMTLTDAMQLVVRLDDHLDHQQ